MSHRIAIIGNSHAGALKSAWDARRASLPGIDLVFFAARSSPNTRMRDLEPVDGRLVAHHPEMEESLRFTSGGLVAIEGERYDAFVPVGLGPRLVTLPPASPYSRAVRAAMYQASRSRGLSRLVANLRMIAPGKPVFVVPKPFPADPPDGAGPASALYDRAVRVMIRRVYEPLGVICLPQPGETVVGDAWTRPEYATGAQKLRSRPEHPEERWLPGEDVNHMNAAYGALVLDQLAAAVRERLAGSSARA